MGAREFEVGQGGMIKVDASEGDRVRIRFGDVWLTQHGDPRDYSLKTGDAMALNAAGKTLVSAYQPTLLELYREDPIGLRQEIERRARTERSADVQAFFGALGRGIRDAIQYAKRRLLPKAQ